MLRRTVLLAWLLTVPCQAAGFAPEPTVPLPGSLTVSLRGRLLQRSGIGRELAGQLWLTVPLDRVADQTAWHRGLRDSARRLSQAPLDLDATSPPQGVTSAEPEATPSTPARSGSARGGADPTATPDKPPGRASRTATRRRPRSQSSEDPQRPPRQGLSLAWARRVVAAALRAQGYSRVARRLRRLSGRARASAVLPQLRLRAQRSIDQSLRLAPTYDDPYRYTQADGADLLLEARLTWKLDRLVFASEELGVERLRRQHAQSRSMLVKRVMAALIRWYEARLLRQQPDLLPEDRVSAVVQQAAAAVELDVLTRGWFSRHRVDRRQQSRSHRSVR